MTRGREGVMTRGARRRGAQVERVRWCAGSGVRVRQATHDPDGDSDGRAHHRKTEHHRFLKQRGSTPTEARAKVIHSDMIGEGV